MSHYGSCDVSQQVTQQTLLSNKFYLQMFTVNKSLVWLQVCGLCYTIDTGPSQRLLSDTLLLP